MYIDKSLTLPEVFEKVGKKDTIEEKVNLLRHFDTKSLRWFVDALYNRDFSSLVIPEYKMSGKTPGIAYMSIQNAIPRLEAALNNHNKPHVVERNLLLVLANLSNEEAMLIEKVIKGERRVAGVSKTVFKKAYPEFFRNEAKESESEA